MKNKIRKDKLRKNEQSIYSNSSSEKKLELTTNL